ncbi:MAG TPA: YARHG domain-containing protein [Cyclobacteriaceae bacterium]|nr:YARHG domain-containing protein [Cyclobacteriaceae bacterium]
MKPILLALCLSVGCSCGSKTETSPSQPEDSTSSTVASNSQPAIPAYEPEPIDTVTFKKFIDLFQESGADMPDWALEFVGAQVGENEHFTTQPILETEPVYLVCFSKFSPVGPGVETLYVATLGKDGSVISNFEMGESYPSSGPGGGGKEYQYTYDSERKVMSVIRSVTDWDEEAQDEFTIESTNPYYINKDGELVAGRAYPQVSEEKLDVAGLSSYSKDELKIMRNEVFAVYGYIFKTEPLKSHFAAMPWYKGEHDNVDDYLTDLEKENIALIKQVENGK